jgi:hypothetical protein
MGKAIAVAISSGPEVRDADVAESLELPRLTGATLGEAEATPVPSVGTLVDGLSSAEADVQSALLRAFIRASDTLTDDYDLESVIGHLIEVCLQLVRGAEVSVILADDRGKLWLTGGSTERKRLLEQYQIDHASGPSIDCYQSGDASSHEWTEDGTFSWPSLAQLTRVMGYQVTRSIPLRLRDDTIGVLSISEAVAAPRPVLQDSLLRALADSTTIGLLNRRTYSASSELSRQLQVALTTRVLIEQSKGVVAARLGLTVDAAFEMLRSYARGSNRKLNEVSRAVLDGTLATHELWPAGRRRPTNTSNPLPETRTPTAEALIGTNPRGEERRVGDRRLCA